jgi:hypothetical protein
VALTFAAATGTSGQIQYLSGQSLAPAFEGWEPNPDGTFTMVFGYLNRNYDEHLQVPVGPNNRLEPGGADQGQPTYFLPRRNRFVFRVGVPKDFGEKELVWTVTAHGKTERAFATLKPDYVLDPRVIYRNNTGLDVAGKAEANKPPVVRVEGDPHRRVTVGEALTLTAFASDDGIPPPTPMPAGAIGFRSALGLRVAWFVYRGDGDAVTFEPAQFKVYPDFLSGSPWTPGWAPPPLPADGKFPVRVTFRAPGTFVLRVMAHDGGADRTQEVVVVVNPATVNSASTAPGR